MKKWTVLGFASLMSLAAVADGPKLTGMVTKQISWSDEDEDMNHSSFSGSGDPAGFATWINLSGTAGTKTLDVGYGLELGTESTPVGSASRSGLITRQVYVTLGTANAGTFTVGQKWLFSAARLLAIDPFNNSGARANANNNVTQWAGFDMLQSGIFTADGIEGFGLAHRAIQEQVSYTTKKFGGFQFDLALDRNGGTSLAEKTALNTPNTGNVTAYTGTVAFDHKFSGGSKLGLTGVFGQQDQVGVNADNTTRYWTAAANLGIQSWNFAVGFSNKDRDVGTALEDSHEGTFVSASYNYNEWTLAATYNALSVQDDTNKGKALETSGSYSLLNLGAIYALNQNVSLTGALQVASASLDGTGVDISAGTTGAQKENDVTSVLAGVTVKF